MTSSATMQQAKIDATPTAQRSSRLSSQLAVQHQQNNASAIQSELSDQRPQATAQRQLQEAADNSPQSRQLNSFQQMAQNSARSTQLKAMSAMMNVPAVQRVEKDDEPLQAKSAGETVQREAADASKAPKPNNTGLPDNLKSGIESLSGMSMDHVKVHYNSSQPAQLNAHAYAQGSEIHVAPGQERHLPHEAWHVVQQAQGRVKPTMQMKAGVPVNDDAGLEAEANSMGRRSLGLGMVQQLHQRNISSVQMMPETIQREEADIVTDIAGTHLTGYSDKAKSLGIANTEVKYETDQLATTGETVGVSMEANPIGPDHPKGDVTDKSVAEKHMSLVGKHDSYIRGHLLNGDIGGPGNAENLFPITSQANSQHYHKIEKHVENWVNAEKKYVYYKVEVKNRDDNLGIADFVCVANQLDSNLAPTGTQIQATIYSKPNNSYSTQNLVNTGGSGNAWIDGQLGTDDIELQKGKSGIPAGYNQIRDHIFVLMELDGSETVVKKLKNLNIKEKMADEAALFLLTGDDAIWNNITKTIWNNMVKKINEGYV